MTGPLDPGPAVAVTTTAGTLDLSPTALSMRAIGPWLQESTRDLDPGASQTLLSRMELAVHEACMNVVDHAGLDAGDRIELTLTLGPAGATVRIRDPGPAFDPGEAAEPPAGELRERGYGVKIVRSLVDDLGYRRIDGHNELALRIDLGDRP